MPVVFVVCKVELLSYNISLYNVWHAYLLSAIAGSVESAGFICSPVSDHLV